MIAGIFSLFGYAFYWKAILKGDTKPSKTTWWILSLLALTLYFSAKENGASETLWLARGQVAGSLVTAFLALKYGERKRERGEGFCILGSVVALTSLWFVQAHALALVLTLLTETFAIGLTVQKSWRNPENEDQTAWTVTQIADGLNLFAISSLHFGDIAYPIWLFVLDGVVLLTLLLPRGRKE